MPPELTLISALLVGFFGSVHCIGMCSGIVGALTIGQPDTIKYNPGIMLPYHVFYNLGRIFSYTIAGGIAGFIGSRLIHTASLPHGQLVGMLISDLFMIALGLYISGWWHGLALLEKVGGLIWKTIQPASKLFFPVRHSWQALMLGLIWGWLPCGMVYAVLAWSLSAGSTIQGAMLMTAFGIGTLPALFALGAFAKWLDDLRTHSRVRQAAGVVILSFGLWLIFDTGQHLANM